MDFSGALPQGQDQDGVAWWFKWLVKIAAVVLGALAFILGIVTVLSISVGCIVGGILLMYIFFEFKF